MNWQQNLSSDAYCIYCLSYWVCICIEVEWTVAYLEGKSLFTLFLMSSCQLVNDLQLMKQVDPVTYTVYIHCRSQAQAYRNCKQVARSTQHDIEHECNYCGSQLLKPESPCLPQVFGIAFDMRLHQADSLLNKYPSYQSKTLPVGVNRLKRLQH